MPSKKILCSISTRGRYFTTLPLAILSVINQTHPVDKLVIYDDNDEPKDMRKELVYQHLFQMLDLKGIHWEWLFALKKGQHHNHQMANISGYEWVWRLDDDTVADPDTLATLYSYTNEKVGAVGGSVLTPPLIFEDTIPTGKIENIDYEPNMQWKSNIKKVYSVDHLHCSFLYRAGVYDYNLGLSRVAHREETLFTYGLKQLGYDLLVVPDAVVWHMKNPEGGIRSETNQKLYEQDEQIFRNTLQLKDRTIVVLNCGMGDHIVFKHVLPDVKNPMIFTCYPDIVPGQSIATAIALFGNIEQYNIYSKMEQWRWTDSLENAFRKLYVK